MDAHLFRLFYARLEPLIQGARIEKIQAYGPAHLALAFFGPQGKRHLYFRFGAKDPFCFLSQERCQALPKPSAAIMRLRKYLQGRRIAASVAQVWSRRLWLMTSGQSGPVWICLDLVHGPGIHFLNETELPEAENPIWPAPPVDLSDPDLWRLHPMLTPRLRQTLAELDQREQGALLADLADASGDVFLYSSAGGEVRQISAWPLPLKIRAGLQEENREDIMSAFEKAGRDLVLLPLFENNLHVSLAPARRREKQLQKILQKLDQDEARLLRMTAREPEAQALAANLWRFAPDAKGVFIDLDLDGENRTIPLDARFTLRQNMERLFHEAKRGKRGLEMLGRRRKEVAEELAALQVKPLAPEAPPKFAPAHEPAGALKAPAHCQAFLSSDSYLILRGKDARGNQAIRKLAAGHDIWVHVEQGAGAHVLIRLPYAGHPVPETTLIEAGTLAANKSWLAQAASGSVMYAEARHLRGCRSGPPGKVTVARLRETRIVPVDHELEARLQARVGGGDPKVSA